MVLDAERVRFAVEYLTRVANDFGSTNMFFVKNCSLLFRAIPQPHANERFYPGSIWQPNLWQPLDGSIWQPNVWQPLDGDSVMSFETEELGHFRGRDPVSAYPLIRLTRYYAFHGRTGSQNFIRTTSDTFPEPLKFLERLLASLVRLVFLVRVFEHSDVSIQDWPLYEIGVQVEIYDLTSSERVKRGVKRAWLIGETLALETGSFVSHSFSLHSFIHSFIHGDPVFDHCEEKRREERELHL